MIQEYNEASKSLTLRFLNKGLADKAKEVIEADLKE
jgi:hypothetical protein